MRGNQTPFLVCEFLPADARLTDRENVQRISQAEFDEIFKEQGMRAYDLGGYIQVELVGQTRQEFTLVVTNSIGPRAVHTYRFVFHKTRDGLRAAGNLELIW